MTTTMMIMMMMDRMEQGSCEQHNAIGQHPRKSPQNARSKFGRWWQELHDKTFHQFAGYLVVLLLRFYYDNVVCLAQQLTQSFHGGASTFLVRGVPGIVVVVFVVVLATTQNRQNLLLSSSSGCGWKIRRRKSSRHHNNVWIPATRLSQ